MASFRNELNNINFLNDVVTKNELTVHGSLNSVNLKIQETELINEDFTSQGLTTAFLRGNSIFYPFSNLTLGAPNGIAYWDINIGESWKCEMDIQDSGAQAYVFAFYQSSLPIEEKMENNGGFQIGFSTNILLNQFFQIGNVLDEGLEIYNGSQLLGTVIIQMENRSVSIRYGSSELARFGIPTTFNIPSTKRFLYIGSYTPSGYYNGTIFNKFKFSKIPISIFDGNITVDNILSIKDNSFDIQMEKNLFIDNADLIVGKKCQINDIVLNSTSELNVFEVSISADSNLFGSINFTSVQTNADPFHSNFSVGNAFSVTLINEENSFFYFNNYFISEAWNVKITIDFSQNLTETSQAFCLGLFHSSIPTNVYGNFGGFSIVGFVGGGLYVCTPDIISGGISDITSSYLKVPSVTLPSMISPGVITISYDGLNYLNLEFANNFKGFLEVGKYKFGPTNNFCSIGLASNIGGTESFPLFQGYINSCDLVTIDPNPYKINGCFTYDGSSIKTEILQATRSDYNGIGSTLRQGSVIWQNVSNIDPKNWKMTCDLDVISNFTDGSDIASTDSAQYPCIFGISLFQNSEPQNIFDNQFGYVIILDFFRGEIRLIRPKTNEITVYDNVGNGNSLFENSSYTGISSWNVASTSGDQGMRSFSCQFQNSILTISLGSSSGQFSINFSDQEYLKIKNGSNVFGFYALSQLRDSNTDNSYLLINISNIIISELTPSFLKNTSSSLEVSNGVVLEGVMECESAIINGPIQCETVINQNIQSVKTGTLGGTASVETDSDSYIFLSRSGNDSGFIYWDKPELIGEDFVISFEGYMGNSGVTSNIDFQGFYISLFQNIVPPSDPHNCHGFQFLISTLNELTVYYANPTQSGYMPYVGTQLITDNSIFSFNRGSWNRYKLFFQKNNDQNIMKLYVNGVLWTQVEDTIGIRGSYFSISARIYSDDSNDARIRNVKIYKIDDSLNCFSEKNASFGGPAHLIYPSDYTEYLILGNDQTNSSGYVYWSRDLGDNWTYQSDVYFNGHSTAYSSDFGLYIGFLQTSIPESNFNNTGGYLFRIRPDFVIDVANPYQNGNITSNGINLVSNDTSFFITLNTWFTFKLTFVNGQFNFYINDNLKKTWNDRVLSSLIYQQSSKYFYIGGQTDNSMTGTSIKLRGVYFTKNTSIYAPVISNINTYLGHEMKNCLINGNFIIDERNRNAVLSTFTLSSDTYVCDKWSVYYASTTSRAANFTSQVFKTGSGLADSPSYIKFSTGSSALTANETMLLQQKIEGIYVPIGLGTTASSYVTVSFWIKSSVKGTYSLGLYDGGGSYSYVFAFSIFTVNTWEQVVQTIPTTNLGNWNLNSSSKGFEFNFHFNGTSSSISSAIPLNSWVNGYGTNYNGITNFLSYTSASLYLTNIQLEPGPFVTPFSRRNYQIELKLCQRYFVSWYVTNATSGKWLRLPCVKCPDNSETNAYGGSFLLVLLPTPLRDNFSTTMSFTGNWTVNKVTSAGVISNVTLSSLGTSFKLDLGSSTASGPGNFIGIQFGTAVSSGPVAMNDSTAVFSFSNDF